MNKHNSSQEMVSKRNKSKVLSCSTPEHCGDSPSRDSDSVCDSECASPVPFLCTQDGAEGETDVVWNFYTPKSGNGATSCDKNSTPLSRKNKRYFRPKVIEKQIPKKRPVKSSQKKSELFQELFELNQNLHELMAEKQNNPVEKAQSGSEDDIFLESQDCSPKCIPKSTTCSLRKNVLSSNFGRPDSESALESDDSMNECLLKASQIVEEKILRKAPFTAKRLKYENRVTSLKTDLNLNMDHVSMDTIVNSRMRLDSPTITKIKKCESPRMNNDSFDNLFGNLNDSALEQLTQMPIKTDLSSVKPKDWTIKELVVHDSSPSSKSFFGRHSSMPESPSTVNLNKPSTSGMSFGRYNSMPFNNEADKSTVLGDSPIRCTPEEIKKKHQLAREKLMAKRLLPFTSQQTQSSPTEPTQKLKPKNTQFQPKIATSATNLGSNPVNNICVTKQTSTNTINMKQLIEKKRQEALMKLRQRQPQNK